MKTALANGLSITALHNHFFFDYPKVYFMHIAARGDAETLSAALKRPLIRSNQFEQKKLSLPELLKDLQAPPRAPLKKKLFKKF
jgi:hypothetical protein